MSLLLRCVGAWTSCVSLSSLGPSWLSLDRFLVPLNLSFPSWERVRTLISAWSALLKMQTSWFPPYANRIGLLLSWG